MENAGEQNQGQFLNQFDNETYKRARKKRIS